METHFPTLPVSASEEARERILADLRALTTDSEALLRATAGDMSDKAKEARARLNTAIEKARASYDDLQARGLLSMKAAASKADDAVRSHPYESVGVAFGLGLLLGAIVARK